VLSFSCAPRLRTSCCHASVGCRFVQESSVEDRDNYTPCKPASFEDDGVCGWDADWSQLSAGFWGAALAAGVVVRAVHSKSN
jgi:hypothetical protein